MAFPAMAMGDRTHQWGDEVMATAKCRWYKDKQSPNGRYLVPGCWNRAIRGDEADCYCGCPPLPNHKESKMSELSEPLKKRLSYMLRAHVKHQSGEGTEAPAVIFADADYEAGDGSCGLHEDDKRANEPAIVYVRADAIERLEAENARPRELGAIDSPSHVKR